MNTYNGSANQIIIILLLLNVIYIPKCIVMKKKIIIIQGFRTRKEVADILNISERTLYVLLKSDAFRHKIPPRTRLSPSQQRLIFDHFGIRYTE